MRTVIYPGSFDPMTNGHLDVVQRAAKLFDRVIVAVALNDSKNPLFNLRERLDLVTHCVGHLPNVETDSFDGLLVEYVEKRSAQAIIRGLRAVSDFEFEFQLALMNRKLNERVETIFMMPKDTYTFLSSRIVKEIARLGGDVSAFVPARVREALTARLAGSRSRPSVEPMALLINLRHLEKAPVRLKGELTALELELDGVDELIRPGGPLKYELTAEKIEKNILVQGRFSLLLRCECARCLKPFAHPLELGDRTLHLPLEGEDQAPLANDCVDLTPYLREDILLELPRHPLCDAECGGLPKKSTGKAKKTGGTGQAEAVSPDWAQLNKLKF